MARNNLKVKSIKTKLILIMLAWLGRTIFLIWSMNELFLPAYYQYTKVSMLEEYFKKTKEIVKNDQDYIDGSELLSDESTLMLEILSANNAANVYVFRLSEFFGNIFYTYVYPSSDK